MGSRRDVVVIGSGPGGLAAAVTCARAGLDVEVLEAEPTLGGGARTLALSHGLTYDPCSAVHPLALASPFLRGFDLAARGVELAVPELSFAHPLDGARAGLAFRDLGATLAHMHDDDVSSARSWERTFGALSQAGDDVVRLLLGDRRDLRTLTSSQMATAARIGVHILERGLRRGPDDMASAMFAGLATHAMTPIPSLTAAGTGLLLGVLAHDRGWAIARGGSQSIADALVADLLGHGGMVTPNHRVRGVRDLPPARAYVFDTSPRGVLDVLGGHLSGAVREALSAFRYGSGAAKVDFVLAGPVPWAAGEVAHAATVHVGGSAREISEAESQVGRGQHAHSPVVLVNDPSVGDPGRIVGGLRPLWTYAHVPAGSTRDMTEQVTAQIERFAPGFRDLIVAAHAVPAAEMSRTNANYIGGDIGAGAITPWQMVARPRLSLDPYYLGTAARIGGPSEGAGRATGPGAAPGIYMCSAATPPGPGVHGMGGWGAARSLLSREFGRSLPPSLAPDAR